jgi:N4-gp56 family major capsid protein
MARTLIGVGDPKAVKKFSVALAVDTAKKSYFQRKFMGEGEDAETPIQMLPNLENDAGDTCSYDLVMQLKGRGVDGDNTLRGNEEDLKFYSDSVSIDQKRHGVNTGGKMTRKRTVHNLRMIGRKRLSDWFARVFDEYFFMYGAGARGTNADFVEDTSFSGFAGNSLVAPDTNHQLYAGAATSKASMVATDTLSLTTIEKSVTRANTVGGGSTGIPQMVPSMVEGEGKYVLVMHEFNAYQVRNNASTGQWIDVQKAAAAAEGRNNPMYKGALGEYNNVVLHSHRSVIRFSDYGAGANLPASRSLFMGRQAIVCAFGSPGTGLRFDWQEEEEDRGNQLVITAGSIFGIKKSAYSIDGVSRDFGLLSIDSYAADPT